MPRRRRVALLVVLCALAAAAVAVGGAALQGGTSGAAAPARASTTLRPSGPPPLDLGLLPGDPHARALLAAEKAYAKGKRREAAKAFDAVLADDPGSVPATIGAALSRWPVGSVQRLRALAGREPKSALARLYLGLALNSSGEGTDAKRAWRRAVAVEPDSRAAVQADSLLHPDMAPGLPFFVPSGRMPASLERLSPRKRLAALESRARTSARAALLLGVVDQQIGRPLSARRAFDHALELDPASLEAQAAAAVGRFTKDDPSSAFSRLGPLAKAHPKAAVLRFHLGVMLLWIRAVDEAKRQLTLAEKAQPGSVWARQAKALLARLAQG